MECEKVEWQRGAMLGCLRAGQAGMTPIDGKF